MTEAPLKAECFTKRDGKTIKCFVEHNMKDKVLLDYTIKIVSEKGKEYLLTDYLKDGATEKIVLRRGERENVFTRFVDAEIAVADGIAEE